MIHIYVGKENFPKDKIVWFDPEEMIYGVDIIDDEFNRMVISKIEKGKYLNNKDFIDRFGYKMHISDISTGSKILLEIHNSNGPIIVSDELGINARGLLLELKDGYIGFDHPTIFPSSVYDIHCSVNGKVVYSSDELNEVMEDLLYGDD